MSEGKVAALFGGPTGERTVDEHLVASLEEYLEMAKAGEIVGASVVVRYHDGLSGYSSHGWVSGHSMVGAATCLHAELVDRARGVIEGDG